MLCSLISPDLTSELIATGCGLLPLLSLSKEERAHSKILPTYSCESETMKNCWKEKNVHELIEGLNWQEKV